MHENAHIWAYTEKNKNLNQYFYLIFLTHFNFLFEKHLFF